MNTPSLQHIAFGIRTPNLKKHLHRSRTQIAPRKQNAKDAKHVDFNEARKVTRLRDKLVNQLLSVGILVRDDRTEKLTLNPYSNSSDWQGSILYLKRAALTLQRAIKRANRMVPRRVSQTTPLLESLPGYLDNPPAEDNFLADLKAANARVQAKDAQAPVISDDEVREIATRALRRALGIVAEEKRPKPEEFKIGRASCRERVSSPV